MRWWRGLENTPDDWRGGVVTIGFFDGVHLGHRRIIRRAVERARGSGQQVLVLTFDPHPAEVLRPGSHPALLTTLEFKAELLAALGVDALCVQPFTLEFSRVTADEFAAKILAETLRARVVVVGENFTYGHRALGTLQTLVRSGAEHGFEVEGVGLLDEETAAELAAVGGDPARVAHAAGAATVAGGRAGTATVMSSTHIRAQVAAGDVAAAARGLGRLHRVEGVVVHGDARGRTIGYPTANLEVTPWAAIPADGVYAGYACWEGHRQPAAISIGTNPTFAGKERRVEAYLLDFDGDLYDKYMAFEFVTLLRPTLKFGSVEELVSQMALDVEATRTATAPAAG
ncbi:MAG: bifunctional riboflavin kinase/FAD synthetase [Frankia sp.]|nr:bifunctional riboflavin kinase/FAD synthetase [Frankia sp.]